MSKQLASKLKKARAKVGETQSQFAKRFGVSVSTVAHWEQDHQTPHGLALEALNAKLDAILKGQ
jgi:putative transcriptional regulator